MRSPLQRSEPYPMDTRITYHPDMPAPSDQARCDGDVFVHGYLKKPLPWSTMEKSPGLGAIRSEEPHGPKGAIPIPQRKELPAAELSIAFRKGSPIQEPLRRNQGLQAAVGLHQGQLPFHILD